MDRIDTRDYPGPNSPEIKDSLPNGFNGADFNDDSMTYDDKVEYIFNQDRSPELAETFSQKRKFIIDEEDVFRNLAATMRNPNVNKLNILDTLNDYKFVKTKK